MLTLLYFEIVNVCAHILNSLEQIDFKEEIKYNHKRECL